MHVDPGTDLGALAAEFRCEPSIVAAEPNYVYKVQSTARPLSPLTPGEGEGTSEEAPPLPDDPFLNSSGSWGQDFPDLWGLFQIGAPAAWAVSQGDGVVVAVVDTGIDITHTDLRANIWRNPGEIAGNGIDDDGNGYVDDLNGWDFTRCAARDEDGTCTQAKLRGPLVRDWVGHGTHVAGTIAAVGNNHRGIIGVAPHAQVMAVKAFDASGTGVSIDIAEALIYAAENGARVINASWSGPASDVIRQAIAGATQLFDVVVVAAAGNDAAPWCGVISRPTCRGCWLWGRRRTPTPSRRSRTSAGRWPWWRRAAATRTRPQRMRRTAPFCPCWRGDQPGAGCGCPKKHLEQDHHALEELSRYWRANLPRLIAQRFALSPEPGFCYSEHDQFR